MPKCVFCGQEIDITKGIGRREECPSCGHDLHCCLQCIFYDRAYADDCRETQAEKVHEKDRSNFCSYFHFGRDERERIAEKVKIKSDLDKLFKK